MTKTLIIIRHGKSSWDYPDIADIDRPLKETGITKTLLVAKKLKERKLEPGLILSSPANRALHTATIVAREIGFSTEQIVIKKEIYYDSETEVNRIIQITDREISTLFLFGHNPTFTNLVNTYLKKPIANLPTSGTVIFEFDCDSWSEISKSSRKNEICIFPKNLK